MSLEQFNTIEATDFIGSGDQEILGLLTQLNQQLRAIGAKEIANNGEIAENLTVKYTLPQEIFKAIKNNFSLNYLGSEISLADIGAKLQKGETIEVINSLKKIADQLTWISENRNVSGVETCNKECTAGCSKGCKSTCGDGCTGSCSGSCSGKCGGQCSNNCSGSCGDICSDNCDVWCSNGCKQSCDGGCSDSCKNGCQGSAKCSACKGKCSGSCTGKCDTLCTKNCSQNCTNTCSKQNLEISEW